MLHLVSGISSPFLFVNLILVPALPFPTHLFLHPSLLPLLIHHSVHLQLPLSFITGLKTTCFTNPTPVVSLLPSGLPPRTLPGPFLLSYSVLILFSPLLFRFWAVRKIKLAIPSAFERTLIHRIVSYRQADNKFYAPWHPTRSISCCSSSSSSVQATARQTRLTLRVSS